jgi:hypothetical protein
MKSGILFLGLTYCSVGAIQAQDAKPDILTNTNVIGMMKAGLPQSLMITTINNNECNFVFDVEHLIILKQALVPEPVLRAMLLKECKGGTTPGKIVRNPALGAIQGSLTKELPQVRVHAPERNAIVTLLKGAVEISDESLVTITATSIDVSAPADESCVSAARPAPPKNGDEAMSQLRGLAACAAKSVNNKAGARSYEILQRVASDQDGHFEIINIPPGDYTLFIKSHTEALMVRDMLGRILTKPVKIKSGKTIEISHDFGAPQY